MTYRAIFVAHVLLITFSFIKLEVLVASFSIPFRLKEQTLTSGNLKKKEFLKQFEYKITRKKMGAYFDVVFSFLVAILVILVDACPPGSDGDGSQYPPSSQVSYYTYARSNERILEVSIESPHRHLKRALGTESRGISAANLFLEFDVNNDDVIDACEWMSSRHLTRIRHYVRLLDDLNIDDDDTISMEEFKSVKVVVKASEE